MMGSHFSISGEHYEKCDHGEKLSKFLAGILKNSLEQFAIVGVPGFKKLIKKEIDKV